MFGIQTFGDHACHPERMSRSPEPFASLKGKLREGEGSGSTGAEILPLRCAQGCGSCAQDDITWAKRRDTTQVLSPNVCLAKKNMKDCTIGFLRRFGI